MPITHNKVTAQPDDPAYDVSADEWNDKHFITSGLTTVINDTTYIDKAHGMATTPAVTDIHITPQDNLGGRSYWVSDVGVTTFRINISAKDTVSHVFSYIIV
jgi:hypothetical protein